MLLLPELLLRLLPDEADDDVLPLRGTFTESPLDDAASWPPLRSLLLWPMQPALVPMLPAAAEVPAAATLAMAPRPSKDASSNDVVRMAISPRRHSA